ncbi:copper chaperone PCu(A)C [uncultured Sphingomonas sp.]|uniref:copper chaperone PCu(A)C n=1 Tax=uncultured Sphingomonas sp. TaxID=158754 RepID=UPI00258C48F3|nr:copper chaperone PCu(A)C [uncultured Sphingomonas sp.]
MKTRWMVLAAAAIALTGCQQPTRVENAWVRLPAVPGRPAAAYATIQPGSLGQALIGVDSPAVGRIELHESMTGHGGMGMMRPLERVALTAHEPTTLAPGGIHAMLFDLKGELRPGGTIPLTFRFDGSQDITVDAKLVGAGDPAPK